MMTPEEFVDLLRTLTYISPIPQTSALLDRQAALCGELNAAYREAYAAAQAANNDALQAQVGAYTPTVPGLQAEDYKTITQLVNEIRQIAATGMFPEGIGSDAVVALWFEEWADTLDGVCLFRRTEPAEGPNSPENASNDVAWRLAEAAECARCTGAGNLPCDECGVTAAPWEPAEHVTLREPQRADAWEFDEPHAFTPEDVDDVRNALEAARKAIVLAIAQLTPPSTGLTRTPDDLHDAMSGLQSAPCWDPAKPGRYEPIARPCPTCGLVVCRGSIGEACTHPVPEP